MSGHIQHKFLRTFFGESFLQIVSGNFQWLHYGVYNTGIVCQCCTIHNGIPWAFSSLYHTQGTCSLMHLEYTVHA